MARTLFGYPQRVKDGGSEVHPDSDDDLRGAEIDKVLDRNWNELLQELRVAETGTQILTGFLLTLPFTNRFATLSHGQERLYLAVLIGSVVATGLNVAPVAYHRILFRRRKRRWLVSAANLAARAALVMLALDSAGVVLLVFDVVVDRTAALVAGGAVLAFLLFLWGVVPLVERASHEEGGHAAEARRSPGSTSAP
ncbi:DUF6328 family protein [Nocardioides pocheonensis]|uniref:DUF6328 family protein n=1 Tax=Nocardioides pocheonensis TaxID=661485 RepID=UPI001622C1F7|nr:DUF6328 family protein [Nocardioides pocheonensis]